MAKQSEADKRLTKASVKKKYLTMFRISILISILFLTIGVIGTGFMFLSVEPGKSRIDESDFISLSIPALISIGSMVIAIHILNILWFRKNILSPLSTVENALNSLRAGNYERKVRLKTNDEFEKIADTFNQLSERLSQVVQLEDEKKQFQDSLMKFLTLISRASEGDLTKRAEITPDLFGSLADALNTFLDKISETIGEVSKIKDELERKLEELSQTVQSLSEIEISQPIAESNDEPNQQSTETVSESLDNQVVDQISESLSKVSQAVNDNIGLLHKISTSFQSCERKIEELREKITEINSPYDTIKDSLNRIGIHSLNISVEASKVGDEGRGIMILAEEIRNQTEKIFERLGTFFDYIGNLKGSLDYLTNLTKEGKSYIDSQSRLLAEIGSSMDSLERAVKQTLSVLPKDTTKEKVEDNKIVSNQYELSENLRAIISDYQDKLSSLSQSIGQTVSKLSSIIERYETRETEEAHSEQETFYEVSEQSEDGITETVEDRFEELLDREIK